MGRAAFGRNETRSFASWQLIFALAESIYLMKALIGSPLLRGSNRPALRRLYAENDEVPIKSQRRIAISELFFRCRTPIVSVTRRARKANAQQMFWSELELLAR
jgi:hypothetical protein